MTKAKMYVKFYTTNDDVVRCYSWPRSIPFEVVLEQMLAPLYKS